MDRKIRVGAVSYLNTKPLIYGFEKGIMKDEVELLFDYPANIAAMLLKDEIDLGLVPVAVIPKLKEQHIISDHCIGCDGEVGSVCLFSEVPMEEIKTILLDYQSRTSAALLKILLKEYWKTAPQLSEASQGYENNIEGSTAALVIGDRALKQRKKSRYIYDLGTAWKEMTGLPFVFAAWVANKKLDEKFIRSFNEVTSAGLQHIGEIAAANPFEHYDLYHYYTSNISYQLDESKRKGLELFLQKL